MLDKLNKLWGSIKKQLTPVKEKIIFERLAVSDILIPKRHSKELLESGCFTIHNEEGKVLMNVTLESKGYEDVHGNKL